MIGLERHIEILLLESDCVMVPGLGGFIAYHIDARYDDADGIFLPPLRTIGFNPQLTMNDSLLVQSYIEVYDVSYPEALKIVEDEVNELKFSIDNQGFYELNGIGRIGKNEDGHYMFEPCEAGILTPDLYGLSSIELPKCVSDYDNNRFEGNAEVAINAKTDEAKHVNIEAESVLEGKNAIPKANVIPYNEAAQDTEDDNLTQKVVSIKVSLLRNIAVACIIVIAFLLFPSTLNDVKNSRIMKSCVNTSLLYNIVPKDTRTNMSASAIMKINKAGAKQDSVNAKTNVRNVSSVVRKDTLRKTLNAYYTIVLASRVTKPNATTYVKQLREGGLDEAVVFPRKVGAKVIYGNYSNENKAYNALNKLRANGKFTDAWVLHVKAN